MRLKIDCEDHFYHSGFLHLIICVLLGYIASNFIKKLDLTNVKKNPVNLKGLTINLVQGLSKQFSGIQIFLFLCRTKELDK